MPIKKRKVTNRKIRRRKKRTHKRKRKFIPKIVKIINSDQPKVSVIIPAANEARSIARVIYHAHQVHPRTETIVVANGSTDGTEKIARRTGAKVLYFSERLGHDIGRSLGAMEAKGEILLFIDADIIVLTKDLLPFVQSVDAGVDIALNKYTGPTNKKNVHPVILAKHAMNIALSRPELSGTSMTTIPHAMSRKAALEIGIEHLAVPPKAQAIAISKGLNVCPVHYVDVGVRKNPRKRGKKLNNPLENLIVGDHLEAINWLMQTTNPRCNHSDLSRMRNVIR